MRPPGSAGISYTDLRDTFASWLTTTGVPLGYVSKQLGHADLAVTAQHYAKWAGGDEYRDPMPRLPGEVPAEFLARLVVVETETALTSLRVTTDAAFRPNYVESLVGRTGLEPVTSAV